MADVWGDVDSESLLYYGVRQMHLGLRVWDKVTLPPGA